MKLQIGLARFPYAGNGGFQSEHPAVGTWMAGLVRSLITDDRCCNELWHWCKGDTPIPMMRNLACRQAMDANVDVLMMIDSDSVPDLYSHCDPAAKKFWDSSFEFLYRRWAKGPCVIMAPYGGPPPHPIYGGSENMYVFRWRTKRNDENAPLFSLEQYTREEAAAMGGIEEVAAGPTGLVMIDLRCLKYEDPYEGESWERLDPPWFDYEYSDKYQAHKDSTEDVFFTRNLSMIGVPQFVNWDAWVGHYKPYLTAKPIVITPEFVRQQYREAIVRGGRSDEQIVELGAGKSVEEIVGELGLEMVGIHGGNGDTRSIERRITENPDGTTGFGCQSIPGDRAILRQTVRKVVDQNPGKTMRILEIGSWVGESALAMAEALGSRENVIKAQHTITCIDTWEGSDHDVSGAWARQLGADRLFELFKKNCGDLYDTVIFPHRGRSPEALGDFPDDAFELIFIDAGHAEHELLADIKASLPKLRKDRFSILSGHDWGSLFPGVERAVRSIFHEDVIHHEGQHWWVEFPAEGESVAEEQIVQEEPLEDVVRTQKRLSDSKGRLEWIDGPVNPSLKVNKEAA
jgi:hypothetical protein